MDILKIRKKIPSQYFDYQRLKNALNDQANERRCIGQLLRKNSIIRVKKGLYIWGEKLAGSGYSKNILANLIYGPSYISLESALSIHDLIPERVEVLTSVTFKKNKVFTTPVGSFTYNHLYKGAYSAGIELRQLNEQEAFLLACPEKALLDYIALRLKKLPEGLSISKLLFEDMRINPTEFSQLNKELIYGYSALYRAKVVKQFARMITDG